MEKGYKWMVCTRCWTYNHAPYITDALNGFTMQETTFPYVCVIVDDASTDGEQEVIKKYLQEHFDLEDTSIVRNEETEDYTLTFARHKTNKNCHFAVLYLKYNHYSIKKSKAPYLKEWQDKCKYIAICEGDDYWIITDKLQKQVDVMENDKSCTMVCGHSLLFSVRRNKIIGSNACYSRSQHVIPQDVIIKGGSFMSTCSILYRPQIQENYPDYCRECHVGDWPLQIMAIMKGNVYYIDVPMAVYRTENDKSWTGMHQRQNIENVIKGVGSEIHMIQGFNMDYPFFSDIFNKMIHKIIIDNCPMRYYDSTGYIYFYDMFTQEMHSLNTTESFLIYLKSSRSSLLRLFYRVLWHWTKLFLY